VARTAPKTELLRALEEKMERYHALRDAVEENDALRKDIEIILGRASSALRLTKRAPDTAPSETATGRRAREEASAAMVRTDPGAETPPPPVEAPVDATRPPTETDPDIQQRQKASPPPATTTPPGPLPSRDRAPSLDNSLPGVRPGASNFSGTARVEHLLMEGEVRMTVSDYANAVKVYEKLVRLAPKVAAFRLRLATAMTCYPRTQKLAERQYFEASRLEPRNADVHHQWGLYYKVMKIKSRAVAEMRAAVRLNPKHRKAREELEALSPKDSALTSLKKLFR
jgi:tetratricopeptide (TPR) repeat protein